MVKEIISINLMKGGFWLV